MAKGANMITVRVVVVSLSSDLRGEKKNWHWMTKTMMMTMTILLHFDLTRRAWTLSTCHALHDPAAEATVIGAAAALVVVADEVVVDAECFGCEER